MPAVLQHRRLQSESAAVATDAGDRTADLIFTTGAAVTRMDWMSGERYSEVLSLEPGHVRMGRLERGAPLLAVHDQFSLDAVIGVTEAAAVGKGVGTARVRFAKTAEGDKALSLVRDKILRNVSVGYIVHRYQKTDAPEGGLPIWRAIDWEPAEISLVPVPADPGAQFRGMSLETAVDVNPQNRKDTSMPHEITTSGNGPTGRETDEQYLARTMTLTTGPERRAEILERTMRAGLDHAFAQSLIDSNLSLQTVCSRIVDEVANRSALPNINAAHSGYVTTEARNGGPETMRRDMTDGLLARLGDRCPNERAARYAQFTLKDMARVCLEATGVRVQDMSNDQIFRRAMSSSDLPNIMGDAIGRRLRVGFDAFPGGVKMISQEKRVRDFRVQNEVQLSEVASLERVLDGAEYKHSRLSDSKETFQLETFGRIISITRHTLVNDDLSAFDRLPRLLGAACREKENAAICAILTANGTMSDGGALFNATAVSAGGSGHANLGTGTGSALAIAPLSTAIKTMRLQKGLDAATPVAIVPKFLVVPANLEATARALVATINPTAIADVNPWQGLLEVLVEPRLDGSSTTAWFLAADPALIDGGIIHAYRDDAPGPQLVSEQNFHTDEWGWKVTLDFTAAVTEWRGLYKANGA